MSVLRRHLLTHPLFQTFFPAICRPVRHLARQDIDTIAPDFETMYAIHTNFQIEQALTENLSFAVGFVHSDGRHIPVYRQINCMPTGATLADGRPLFGTLTGTRSFALHKSYLSAISKYPNGRIRRRFALRRFDLAISPNDFHADCNSARTTRSRKPPTTRPNKI